MGTIQIDGSTPKITVGNATAEDATILFDGNAQDFYIALDDSADDLLIGLGSTVGTTPIIAIDENKLSTFSGAITVGVDNTGHDVKYFGATSGNYWLWDESADGVVQIGTLTVGVDNTGHDVKLFGATAGSYWLWDESADGVVQVGTLTVGVDDAGHDVKLFGNAAGAYMEWDASADELRIMGASADATTSTGKLLLATSLADINANDVIGKIDFQAPHEAGGTDAITVAASIRAIAQATFSSSVNATDLIFYTGHSEAAAEKIRFTSQNEIGIAGANYGTDGQVLTSAGAGAAVAWEDAGGAITALNNATANELVTVGATTTELEAEAKLLFSSATLTIGNATAEDAAIVFDGNAQDFYIGLDDSADDLVIGVGSSVGTTPGMSFTEDGDIHMGMTAATEIGIGIDPDSAPTNAKLVLSHNNSVAPEGHLLCHELRSGGTAQTSINFYREDTQVGNIYTTDDATTYNTSSDYRLKENLVPISDGIDRVKQLNPYRFNFIKNASKTVDGFVAHEVGEIVPQAIGGEKDAMMMQRFVVTPAVRDEAGNITTKAVMEEREVIAPQSIDTSMLVPLLTGALKELIARVETLEG